jgi:hypothetical protein
MRRTCRLGIGLIVSLVVLAGCGDDSGSAGAYRAPGTAEPGDAATPTAPEDTDGAACGFLSPEGVEGAIGTPAGTGALDERVSSDQQAVCLYDLADGWIQVLYGYGGDATRHRHTTETLGEMEAHDVAELPDGFYVPDLGMMGAQAGGDYAQVTVHLDDGEPSRDQLIALLEELLASR